MLSHAHAPTGGRTAVSRAEVLRAVLRPTARVSRVGSAAVTVAMAAMPAVINALLGGRAADNALIVAVVFGGAALAWSVEDPVAELFAALPVSCATRRVVRAGWVSLVVAAGLAVTVAVMAVGPGLPRDWGDRVAEGAAAAAVSLAVGLVAVRRGERAAGPVGVVAGALGVTVVGALALRWPTVLPRLAAGPTHGRWWVIAAASVAVAARAGRDPGRR